MKSEINYQVKYYGQYIWKGWQISRSEQREKVSCNVVSKTMLINLDFLPVCDFVIGTLHLETTDSLNYASSKC